MMTISKYGYLLLVVMLACQAHAEEPFRTDGGDEKLPWFQLIDGQFPPARSAHYFAGELINVDHLNRQFVLRIDRSDAQNRGNFDLPRPLTMLPFGSIYYHGAPASLADIPLGTHLHGLFYAKDPDDKSQRESPWYNPSGYELEFTRCFRLEDDFSYYARQSQVWRVEEVDLEKLQLTTVLLDDEKVVGEPKVFDLQASTRLWHKNAIASLKDLARGQLIQFNMTWATLYGPGRLTEIWLDPQSRELATAHQLEKHHIHIRQHGLAGWVDAVDNQKRLVTITLFGGVDTKLLEEASNGKHASLVVARNSLMTYDPVNDRKGGPIREVKQLPPQPGSSGVQIQVQPDLLLEGFRPKHIVRVYLSGWPIVALPREERYFGR